MKIALVSDIHGNYAALEAFERLGIAYDCLYCLGDVVGYGPFPNECVEWIQRKATRVIKGNHERALSDPETFHRMNALAATQVRWTLQQLKPENKTFLCDLPSEIKETPYWICHGSPVDPDEYIVGPREVRNAFYALEEAGLRIALFGHTHYPGVVDEEGNFWYGREYDLDATRLYLINPGSVGQPRDGDWRSSFCVLDTENLCVSFYRYEYDIEKTVKAIQDKHLPPELAYRLMVGR